MSANNAILVNKLDKFYIQPTNSHGKYQLAFVPGQYACQTAYKSGFCIQNEKPYRSITFPLGPNFGVTGNYTCTNSQFPGTLKCTISK